jgi:hypothetical protein
MKLKEFYISLRKNDLNKGLITLIFLPFLFDIFLDIKLSQNVFLFILLIIFLLLIDKLLKKRYNSIILSVLFVFIYSQQLYDDNYFLLAKNNITLRFRDFLIFFSILTFLIFRYFSKKNNLRAINYFLIFFSITKFLPDLYSTNRDQLSAKNFKKIYDKPILKITKSEKPVLLIIMDELASLNDLSSIDKKLNYDQYFNEKGFVFFDNVKSQEFKTSFSLSSLLNFNLKNSAKFENLKTELPSNNLENQLHNLIRDNILVDSLNKKGVTSNSYGVLNFNNSIAHNTMNYSLWNSKKPFQIDRYLYKTLYKSLIKKVKNYPPEYHEFEDIRLFKEEVFKELNSFNPKPNNFYYFHIFAPHNPFTFEHEFKPDLNFNTTENYVLFQKFILNKLLKILTNKKFDDCRIILSGDHGYRSDQSFDKFSTSVFLKGYDSIIDFNQMSVQDIGYIVNESF